MTHTPRRSRWLAPILGAVVATTTLAACAPLLIGGAVVGGAMLATDRRTSGAQVDDEVIELKTIRRMNESFGDRAWISTTSYNRTVLLTGEVPSEQDKASAGRIASQVENVKAVVNELELGVPRALSTRTNDTLITGKVKASLVDAKDVFANSVKVVTHSGVVYLMGRVTEREANRVTDIARGVPGVRKVVRVFEVLTESELANVPSRPASAP